MISERLPTNKKINQAQPDFFDKIKTDIAMQNSLRKPKLLVVDDEPHILKLLNFTLRNNFDVIEASSANEAIYKARLEQPQIILSDLLMPTMNGTELCEELKKYKETKNIPFVFLTAQADYKQRLNTLKTNASDYITKPFDPTRLIKKLRSTLLF